MAPRLIQQENLVVNQEFRIAQFTGAGFTPAGATVILVADKNISHAPGSS